MMGNLAHQAKVDWLAGASLVPKPVRRHGQVRAVPLGLPLKMASG